MVLRNEQDRYGAVAQGLHWAIVVLIVIQITLGVIGADLPVGMERLITLSRHKSLGMTIMALMVVRLMWRLMNPVPVLPSGMSKTEQRLARSTHWLLYGLLLVMPVVGWVGSSASNLTVSWFGVFTFPDLVETDKALAAAAKALHRGMAWTLMALVSLHALAALRHHFLLKDTVLLRMLPRRRKGPGEST